MQKAKQDGESSRQRGYYVRTMTARVQLKKPFGHEFQGARH